MYLIEGHISISFHTAFFHFDLATSAESKQQEAVIVFRKIYNNNNNSNSRAEERAQQRIKRAKHDEQDKGRGIMSS